MQKRKLSNINISFISLVKNGANGKKIVVKNDEFNMSRIIKINKSNIENGVIYGIVYSPDEIDTQGDFASAEEITKASYSFMKSLNVLNVDTNHNFKTTDAYVCESWILKAGDPVFKTEKPGSWAVGIKIESEELRQAIVKGEFEALSMAGTAEFEIIEKEDKEDGLKVALNGFLNEFKNILKGSKKMQETTQTQNSEEIAKTDENIVKIEKIEKQIEDIFSKLEALEKLTKLSKQDTELQKEETYKGYL